jgi:mono/diheme cytochrome c family protein
MRRFGLILVALIFAGGGLFWLLTAPKYVDPADLSGLVGDAAHGEKMFALGGCASCHAAPDATGAAKLVLSGGKSFVTEFGTFYAPNISPDPKHGIGGWSDADLASAMRYGSSPEGSHYYPAFPYTSYSRASLGDIVDLRAYLNTLPATAQPDRAHDVGFPFNIRRSLGGWKLLFLRDGFVLADAGLTDDAKAGRDMVEALGHCAECHTPRGMLGNLRRSVWMSGAPNPSGRGTIPPLAPGAKGLSWSESDIAEYLKSGFTPDFDTAGGEMAEVVENTSQLSDAERLAIAAYLKALPPLD